MTTTKNMYWTWNTDHRIALAKWYGKRHNIKGNGGGWLYLTRPDGVTVGKAIAQGWHDLYCKRKKEIWEQLNNSHLVSCFQIHNGPKLTLSITGEGEWRMEGGSSPHTIYHSTRERAIAHWHGYIENNVKGQGY